MRLYVIKCDYMWLNANKCKCKCRNTEQRLQSPGRRNLDGRSLYIFMLSSVSKGTRS